MKSSCDIDNPIYSRSGEPRIDSCIIIDKIEDDDGRDFTIKVHYDFYRRDGITFVTWCSVQPLQDFYHATDISIGDSVKELVYLNENCCAKFLCNVEIKHI